MDRSGGTNDQGQQGTRHGGGAVLAKQPPAVEAHPSNRSVLAELGQGTGYRGAAAPAPRYSARRIIARCVAEFGIDPDDLLDTTQKDHPVIAARQMVGYMLLAHAAEVPEAYRPLVYRPDGARCHNALRGCEAYEADPVMRDRVACVLGSLAKKGAA